MSRNRKRNNVRRRRRFTRRKRQAPLHIPSVPIQPWRRITLVIESNPKSDAYEVFAVTSLCDTLASQTTLTIDDSHPYLIKFSRVRIWNQGQKNNLGPLGLMPFSLLNTGTSKEPLSTYEDHPVGINPARAQYTWPRLHQQIILHSVDDKNRLIYGVHGHKGDKLIHHVVLAYKPASAVDFVMYSGSAPTTPLRRMEL